MEVRKRGCERTGKVEQEKGTQPICQINELRPLFLPSISFLAPDPLVLSSLVLSCPLVLSGS